VGKEQESSQPAHEQHKESAHMPASGRGDIARRIKDAAHAASSHNHEHHDRQGTSIESLLHKHYPDQTAVTNRQVINALYAEYGPSSRNTYAQAERRHGLDIDQLRKHRDAQFPRPGKAQNSKLESKSHAPTLAPHEKPAQPSTDKSAAGADKPGHGKTPGSVYSEFSRGHFDRGRFSDELKRDPALREELTKLAVKEVGGRGAKVAVAFFESLFNRATREHLTINAAIHNGYYGPINRHEVEGVPTNTTDYGVAENSLVTALEGTNVIGGRMHQEYREWYARAMNGDPKTFLRIGREIFYNKFGDKKPDEV